ncbi:acetylornithine deacetylase [Pseudoxanthobacter sp.]|uniref:acetylornithine deacetylase n=1 Tax=Pseudoxanthobacter sp. TaxID=1925742 RepID=UPI002FE20797
MRADHTPAETILTESTLAETTLAEQILARLVAFPSVVGRPNGPVVEWIAGFARSHGARVSILPGPEGDRANLFISIGPAQAAGLILSGHMDVVPADEPDWHGDPFCLRATEGRLYGRGTSDMKGFLACALAALPAAAAAGLSRPLHLAFSYDEEAGCRGAPHLLARLGELCAPPEGCIVGEPSGLRAVRAHKGKAAARLQVHGCPCHSSRPDLGRNAIHAMADVLAAATGTARTLQAGPFDAAFEPPYSSLQVGVIRGGAAVNIVPAFCEAEVEARAITGVPPAGLLEPVRAAAEGLKQSGFEIRWDQFADYPALSLPADAPLARLMADVTGCEPLAAVSYGTEAGLYQAAGIPAIVCGPGDIARAHRPDEYVTRDELAACSAMIARLIARLA